MDDRKATPGITESSQARAHIDLEACYFAVGPSHPGCASAAKGGGVHPLKRIASWVQNGASQFGCYLLGVLVSERKVPIVRKEHGAVASGLSVVQKGMLSSYAIEDKS